MNMQKPIYLMSGGRSRQGKKKDTIMPALFKETGKVSPTIGYIGAASDDDPGFFKFISAEFIQGGASEVVHALTVPSKADLDKTRDILQNVDAVFISGGDVERGMQVLEEKQMTAFLEELYHSGKVFFGASAGSIMLAREWIRWTDPEDDSTAELFSCLGFASLICDTHAEEDGWEELQTALSMEKDSTKGYGIATGVCLKFQAGREPAALGGPVYVYQNKAGKVERQPDLLPA